MTLTNKQIKFLKKEAHHLKPIFQVGKSGVSEDMLMQIGQALEKRELIKVTLLQNTMEDESGVAQAIEETVVAQVVQIIGHTLVLYKKSQTEKYRKVSTLVEKIV